ncbi:MAG: hypothetical protein ACFFEU_02045 [Candidatus Thorarchaeota archaeon]
MNLEINPLSLFKKCSRWKQREYSSSLSDIVVICAIDAHHQSGLSAISQAHDLNSEERIGAWEEIRTPGLPQGQMSRIESIVVAPIGRLDADNVQNGTSTKSFSVKDVTLLHAM